MKSKTVIVLFLFLLIFFSSNAFAGYDTILNGASILRLNPFPIVSVSYPNQTGNLVNDGETIKIMFSLMDYSTDAVGNTIDPNFFTIRIDRKDLIDVSNPDRYIEFIYDPVGGITGGAGMVTTGDSGNFGDLGVPPNFGSLSFDVQFQIQVTNYHKWEEIKNIPMWIQYNGVGDFYPLFNLSRPGWPYHLNVKASEFLSPVPDPLADLNVWLGAITCGGADPAVITDGLGVVRCDNESGLGVSSNTIEYNIWVEDINNYHNFVGVGPGVGHDARVEVINLVCSTDPQGFARDRRLMHYPELGCFTYGREYADFPPTCDFMYYANGIQPGHNDCIIDVYDKCTTEEYAIPPAYNIALPSCDGDGDCVSGPDIYYNSNYFWLRKYVDPDSNPLRYGNGAAYSGTITNDATGGNFKCQGWVEYGIYNIASGNKINNYNFTQEMILNGSNAFGPHTDGSREIMVWNENPAFYKTIKLEGHEAYFDNPTLSSPFIRPFSSIDLFSDVVNTGKPWDGAGGEILYFDIIIYDDMGNPLPGGTANLFFPGAGPLGWPAIPTDTTGAAGWSFPVTPANYHDYLSANYAEMTLYDDRGGFIWYYDIESSFRFIDNRLIAILDPAAYVEYGSSCYTDESIEDECWWTIISWDVLEVDVNSNSMPEFVLRLKNPLDDSEEYDLSYDSNKVLGKALLEFDPERNFIPGFDYASSPNRFGVKYAKMILTNPRILSGDSNYLIKTTSVNYPFIWDNVWIKFRTDAHNLKAESLRFDPEKDEYSLSDPPIKFTFGIRNTGTKIERNVQFKLVSSMDSSVVFTAPPNTKINPGQIIYFTGILPPIPSKDVFIIEATVDPVPFEYDYSDNSISKVITVEYSGDLSLPETNYLFILLIIVSVLFVVRKK